MRVMGGTGHGPQPTLPPPVGCCSRTACARGVGCVQRSVTAKRHTLLRDATKCRAETESGALWSRGNSEPGYIFKLHSSADHAAEGHRDGGCGALR